MLIKPPKVDVHCAGCGRFLCRAGGDVEVECKRCLGRTIFDYSTKTSKYLSREDKNKFH
jgi:phage FluMu protein Com